MNEELVAQLFGLSKDSLFSIGDMLAAMTVTTVLIFILAKSYKDTHTGPNYSKSFLTSLFIMSIATSIVMMIIGSNIARAFSLIGALSIIRFRTAVKDPRDTAFLFAGVVAGMGCGTGFYLPAIVLTLFITCLLYIMDHYEVGTKKNMTTILKLNLNKGIAPDLFTTSLKSPSLINKISDFSDDTITYVYSFTPKNPAELIQVEEKMSAIDGVNAISIYQADQHAPF